MGQVRRWGGRCPKRATFGSRTAPAALAAGLVRQHVDWTGRIPSTWIGGEGPLQPQRLGNAGNGRIKYIRWE